MPTVILNPPRPHPAQQTILDSVARYKVVCCGRRFGKTQLMAHTLGLGNGPHQVGALQGYPVAYCSLTYKNVKEMWERLKVLYAPLIDYKHESDHYLRLKTGGSIECWSLDKVDTMLGRAYAGIVVDEAAAVVDLQYAWEKVLLAMLLDYRGWALLGSTPNGFNYFYELFLRGQDVAFPEWQSWNFSSYDNPYIAADELDAIRQTVPDHIWEQEYLAHFVLSEGAVFKLLEGNFVTDIPIPQSDHVYIGAIDWGIEDDYTAFSIFDTTDYCEVYLKRWRQQSWRSIEMEIVQECRRWNIEKVEAERNAMGRNIEELHLRFEEERLPTVVEPFTMTNQRKDMLVKEFQNALVDGYPEHCLKLLDIDYATQELRAFQTKQLASGLWTYSHPDGGHDDTVIARLLANYACHHVGWL